MGIDGEELLDVEGDEIADAYDDSASDAEPLLTTSYRILRPCLSSGSTCGNITTPSQGCD